MPILHEFAGDFTCITILTTLLYTIFLHLSNMLKTFDIFMK